MVRQPLKDSPYRLVKRLSPTEVVLVYEGHPPELWRDVRRRCVAAHVLEIVINRVAYQFAGRYRAPAAKGGAR